MGCAKARKGLRCSSGVGAWLDCDRLAGCIVQLCQIGPQTAGMRELAPAGSDEILQSAVFCATALSCELPLCT